MTRFLWLALWLGLANGAQAESCDVVLKSSDLKPIEINGQRLVVVDVALVTHSVATTGCVQVVDELLRLRQAIASRDQLLADFRQLTADYEGQLAQHGQVLDRSQRLNEDYSHLSEDFSQQLQSYQQITSDMSDVAHRLDDLAGEYRDLASDMLYRYRLGAALGGGSDGLAGQLQFGYDHLNLYLHNYDNHTSALVGAEIRF
ncbi:hypothetical protein [Parathalassolituus penaei]|uniref:Uncharacterized protein n=1 Tax=Parathalassolituus penaei TaxID=2997323 RepID=A0A9X3ENL6_9GAMM|nr:hypothetical protein [Parathalassolituus penaei]MCY0965968.1 hypothetical protein [Parathalassolituus penaei]